MCRVLEVQGKPVPAMNGESRKLADDDQDMRLRSSWLR
jgi:hypothetical protein